MVVVIAPVSSFILQSANVVWPVAVTNILLCLLLLTSGRSSNLFHSFCTYFGLHFSALTALSGRHPLLFSLVFWRWSTELRLPRSRLGTSSGLFSWQNRRCVASSPDQRERRCVPRPTAAAPSHLFAADLHPIAACPREQNGDDWQPSSNAIVVDRVAEDWLLPAAPPTETPTPTLPCPSPPTLPNPARSNWSAASSFSHRIGKGIRGRAWSLDSPVGRSKAATAKRACSASHSTTLAARHFLPRKVPFSL
ncbi:hypothetical protein N657DRAFT_203204 [Parathielavia appendiculata]|uniref:Uncharacterized protein n=1 Tax=Parathielavia appendiculata TaxID=2587402 RepID=A0AAN6U6D2_9PEZI|nr:hypothetical protein N657DRAFT_203204 [Parathielavia appendiculata]